MNEHSFRKAVDNKINSTEVRKWKINDIHQGGVPDSFYRTKIGKGQPLWVEYKFIKKLPARDTTLVKPDLSQLQLNWLNEAVDAGEQAIVVVGLGCQKIGRESAGIILLRDQWEGISKQTALECIKPVSLIADYISNSVVICDLN